MPVHPGVERLKAMFATLDDDAEESVGLLLTGALQPSGYDATLEGALMFAATGGDGVHFSFLPHGQVPDRWPVVMTVPMQFDAPNLVVGETLADFLALGLRSGYFVLEQLAYDRAGTVAWLDEVSARTAESTMAPVLGAIAQLFDLVPWTDHAGRLDRLQALMGGNGDNRT